MKLTKKQVENVARLARLGLTEKEKNKFQKELSDILGFVKKLDKVKTDKVESTAHITGLENIYRQDRGRAKARQETKKILELAPETKDGYVKVRTVL